MLWKSESILINNGQQHSKYVYDLVNIRFRTWNFTKCLKYAFQRESSQHSCRQVSIRHRGAHINDIRHTIEGNSTKVPPRLAIPNYSKSRFCGQHRSCPSWNGAHAEDLFQSASQVNETHQCPSANLKFSKPLDAPYPLKPQRPTFC